MSRRILISKSGLDKRPASEQPLLRVVRVVDEDRNETLLTAYTYSQPDSILSYYYKMMNGELGQDPTCFDQYICHGHLHGLSEQQWSGAMGGRLRVNYYSGVDTEGDLEQADDEQVARAKDGMFPARLDDVVDKVQYRRLQRAEIRRMAAIATRLILIDEGADVALFPCFQTAEMRRHFEVASNRDWR